MQKVFRFHYAGSDLEVALKMLRSTWFHLNANGDKWGCYIIERCIADMVKENKKG